MDFEFSQLFLYVPGVIIFLIGTGGLRRDRQMRRLGACTETSVVSCSHVLKKDKKGRDVFNYYNVVVEYPTDRGPVRETVKSPTEYSVGQQVKLFRDGDRLTLVQQEDRSLFGSWSTSIGGALLVLLALFENRGQEMLAMTMLTIVLVGAGIILLRSYFQLRRRGLTEIPAEIIDVYSRQISKGTKILKDSKFTYYPVVSYELEGKKNIRRCNVNSSRKKDFEVGEKMSLYYDPKTRQVLERRDKLSVAIWGGALLGIGVLAGLSLLAAIIQAAMV